MNNCRFTHHSFILKRAHEKHKILRLKPAATSMNGLLLPSPVMRKLNEANEPILRNNFS